MGRSYADAVRYLDAFCGRRHDGKLPPLVSPPTRKTASPPSAGLNSLKLRPVSIQEFQKEEQLAFEVALSRRRS
jgi:hypothetical protein